MNTMPEPTLMKHDIVILLGTFLTEDIPIKQGGKGQSNSRTTCLFKTHLLPAHIIYNGENIVVISMEAVNVIGV